MAIRFATYGKQRPKQNGAEKAEYGEVPVIVARRIAWARGQNDQGIGQIRGRVKQHVRHDAPTSSVVAPGEQKSQSNGTQEEHVEGRISLNQAWRDDEEQGQVPQRPDGAEHEDSGLQRKERVQLVGQE